MIIGTWPCVVSSKCALPAGRSQLLQSPPGLLALAASTTETWQLLVDAWIRVCGTCSRGRVWPFPGQHGTAHDSLGLTSPGESLAGSRPVSPEAEPVGICGHSRPRA